MDAPFYGTDGTTHYAFEWIVCATKPTKNYNGTTGWATMTARSCGPPGEGLHRAHRCAHNPCLIIDEPESFYKRGKPLHIQPTDWRPPAPSPDAPVPSAAAGESEKAPAVPGALGSPAGIADLAGLEGPAHPAPPPAECSTPESLSPAPLHPPPLHYLLQIRDSLISLS